MQNTNFNNRKGWHFLKDKQKARGYVLFSMKEIMAGSKMDNNERYKATRFLSNVME
jgi:hypothetical protein